MLEFVAPHHLLLDPLSAEDIERGERAAVVGWFRDHPEEGPPPRAMQKFSLEELIAELKARGVPVVDHIEEQNGPYIRCFDLYRVESIRLITQAFGLPGYQLSSPTFPTEALRIQEEAAKFQTELNRQIERRLAG